MVIIMVVIMVDIMVIIMVIIMVVIIKRRGYRSTKSLKLNCYVYRLIGKTDCTYTDPTSYGLYPIYIYVW